MNVQFPDEPLGDAMPDQKSNAGNEGDVMKHPPLHKVVEQHSKGKDEFWYVETHAGYPYYFLPARGSWEQGIRHVAGNQVTAPALLTDYAALAYHDAQAVLEGFPDKRTYLGSAAQVFQFLKAKTKRIRMTLFEREAAPAQQLFEYFQDQGAKAVLVRPGSDADHAASFLRNWWDAAVAKTNDDDFVMVVQSDSYALAPELWAEGVAEKPDLVFVDPFKINDSNRQPQDILASLSRVGVPFMCWTPSFSVPTPKGQQWPDDKWSFQIAGNQVGDRKAQNFVDYCMAQNHQIAWFSWAGSNGARQKMHGCQLTFGNVFCGQFTPAAIWPLANGLPYIDLNNLVAHPVQQGRNFLNPITTWQTEGQALNWLAQTIQAGNQPGAQWWNKYHVAGCDPSPGACGG